MGPGLQVAVATAVAVAVAVAAAAVAVAVGVQGYSRRGRTRDLTLLYVSVQLPPTLFYTVAKGTWHPCTRICPGHSAAHLGAFLWGYSRVRSRWC